MLKFELQYLLMNKETADKLTDATLRFYEQEAQSFSATRTKPWAGWYRCADMISQYLAAKKALHYNASQNNGDLFGSSVNKPVDATTGTRAGSNMGTGVAVNTNANIQANSADPNGFSHASSSSSSSLRDFESSRSSENSYIELLDLACGNLRFEQFMTDEHPDITLSVNAVDNEEALVFDLMKTLEDLKDLNYQHLNITEALKTERELENLLEAPLCDVSVCFGFLHHVPQSLWRRRLLQALIKSTCKKGLIIVTFWQFVEDKAKREKLRMTTERAAKSLKIDMEELAENDFILGWQNKTDTWRYCHYFDDEEIKQIVSSLEKLGGVRLASSFCADGKTGNQNRYIVLERI